MALLGEGAYGKVYKKEIYAIKCVTNPKSFLQELNAARVPHRNTVEIFGYQIVGKNYAIVLKKYDRTLYESIDGSHWTTRKIFGFVRQMVSAIYACHLNGVVHCDIKPDNIMEHNGQFLLIDFGLSALINPHGFCFEYKRGTKGYLAPELGNHDEKIAFTPSVDIYSFGITLKEVMEKCGMKIPFFWYLVDVMTRSCPSCRPTAYQLCCILNEGLCMFGNSCHRENCAYYHTTLF